MLVVFRPRAALPQRERERVRNSAIVLKQNMRPWLQHCRSTGRFVNIRKPECVCTCARAIRKLECARTCSGTAAAPEQVAGSPAGGLTRLPTFLNVSHVCSGCRCSSGLRLFLCPHSLCQRLLRSYRSMPPSGSHVPAKPAPGSSFLYLLQQNLISETIRHCASCEQLKKPSKWTWPCVTGPLHYSSVCPAWPLANVWTYHIAYSNLWKQDLAALCGLVIVLK